MKKIYLTLLLSMIAGSIIAQTAESRFAIPVGFSINHLDTDGAREIFDLGEGSFGFETGLKYYLSPSFNLAGNVSRFKLDTDGFSTTSTDLDLSLEFKLANGSLLSEESKFRPYLTGGIGSYLDDENFAVVPLGAGVRSTLKDNVDWFAQTRYKLSPKKEDFNYLTTSIGLVFGLGGKKDSDGDGVLDKDDNCPYQSGSLSTNGCPDSDGDGIADKEDNCPQLAGIASMMGCPDSDGDGVMDLEDACPNEAGSKDLKGCPDSDGDGIADTNDLCPDQKGTQANGGCPDSDGDGVVDKDDKCPTEPGLAENQGCKEKDTDGDGIIDKEDNCPTIAGIGSNGGCPEIEDEVKEVLKEALEGVQFKSGSDVLVESSYAKLDKVADVMNSHDEFKLQISGYTDNTGNADSNLELSKKRAHAAEKYLIDKGIDASRITAEGYGIANPVADNSTREGRAKNRRVEFKIVFQ